MRIVFDQSVPHRDLIAMGANVIAEQGIVAYPTESSYALGVSALDKPSCDRLFEIKSRMRSKPLPCIISDYRQISSVSGELPEPALRLAKHFWPGPLTMILKAKERVAAASCHGTVAVRVSAHPFARSLAAAAGPITSTSANLSGNPGISCGLEVDRVFGTRVDLVLDPGRAFGGLPSTIVDVTTGTLKIVRHGPITKEEIESV